MVTRFVPTPEIVKDGAVKYREKKTTCWCGKPLRPNGRYCLEHHRLKQKEYRNRVKDSGAGNQGLFAEMLRAFKRKLVLDVLREEHGSMTAAAVRLGMHRNSVTRLLHEIGLSREEIKRFRTEGGFWMKPRKRVLLYCADYDRRNELAFVLRTGCTWARIDTFAMVEELVEHMHDPVTNDPLFDCILMVMARPEDHGRIDEQIGIDFLLRDPEVAAHGVEVRVTTDLAWSPLSMRRVVAGDIASLIDAMKTACSRKRGLKKRWIVRHSTAPAPSETAVE